MKPPRPAEIAALTEPQKAQQGARIDAGDAIRHRPRGWPSDRGKTAQRPKLRIQAGLSTSCLIQADGQGRDRPRTTLTGCPQPDPTLTTAAEEYPDAFATLSCRNTEFFKFSEGRTAKQPKAEQPCFSSANEGPDRSRDRRREQKHIRCSERISH